MAKLRGIESAAPGFCPTFAGFYVKNWFSVKGLRCSAKGAGFLSEL